MKNLLTILSVSCGLSFGLWAASMAYENHDDFAR